MTENQTTKTYLNVYQKLAKARFKLSEKKIKKSGKNTYSNFTYYELGDFLPYVNELNAEIGLMTHFEIIETENDHYGKMTIFNTDEPEEFIVFTSDAAEVEIGKKKDGTGGADKIQNIGGKQTYLRRYLFIMAYEIAENDSVDAEPPKNEELEPLDDITLDDINSAQNLDELIATCKKATEKTPQKRKQIEVAYSQKKNELKTIVKKVENENI